MKLNWFKRSDDPNDLLCLSERFAYACSNTGIVWSYILMLAFLTFYYTNVVGLDVGKVGTILLISRVFDGLSDLLMGYIIDKTNSKWGKARPWLFIGTIPHAIATILAFSVPMGASDTIKYVYVFVTYNLANTVTYTMCSTSLYTQNNLNTCNSEERMKSGIWFQIGANLVMFIVNATFIKWVTAMGGDAGAWRTAVAVFSAIGMVLMLFSALCTKERVTPPPSESAIPLKKRLVAVFTDKNWLLFVFSAVISYIGYGLITGGCLYYCQDILGDVVRQATLSSLLTAISFGVLLTVMTPIVKKIGNVAVRQMCYISFIIGCTGMLLTTNWTVVLIMYVLIGFGYACMLGSQGAMMADTIQHAGDKAGFDVSGVGNAAQSFVSKVASGLGGGLMGWVLKAFGYDGTAAVQSAQGILGVKVAVLVIPIVCSAIAALLLSRFDLYKKGYIKEAGRG